MADEIRPEEIVAVQAVIDSVKNAAGTMKLIYGAIDECIQNKDAPGLRRVGHQAMELGQAIRVGLNTIADFVGDPNS